MSNTKDSIYRLINCAEETIHTPGYIQPHGFLMVLSEPDLKIIQLSNNVEQHLGIKSEKLLNQNLENLLEEKKN